MVAGGHTRDRFENPESKESDIPGAKPRAVRLMNTSRILVTLEAWQHGAREAMNVVTCHHQKRIGKPW